MPAIIQPLKFRFLPEDIELRAWKDIQPYADDILARTIDTLHDYSRWLEDANEITTFLSEEFEGRYTQKSRYTNDREAQKKLDAYLDDIAPPYAAYTNAFQKRAISSPFAKTYREPGFELWCKTIITDAELYSDKNHALLAEDIKAGGTYAEMQSSVTVEGKVLAEAAADLASPDRVVREQSWRKIEQRRLQDAGRLDDLYDTMVKRRHAIARNAGCADYIDYRFKQLKRFDYTPEDCRTFHASMQSMSCRNCNPCIKGTLPS